MNATKTNIVTCIRKVAFVLSSLIVLSNSGIAIAQSISKDDVTDITGPGAWYDPNFGGCDSIAAPGTGVGSTKSQTDNAKTIMGIAKTYNLDQKAALIALMVGLAESGISNYANSNIAVSKQNPDWLALPDPRPLGNDHDSVGIMQQRPSTGWSTYGSGTSQEIVWQLMTPAYAAQAFLGTPPNAQLPSNLKNPGAIKKGLQNVSGWQSMDPWVAAQKTQISAYDGNPRDANNHSSVVGGNYKAKMSQAQSLLNKYWADAPAIPLPIPVTGGQSTGGSNSTATVNGCDNSSSTFVGGTLTQTILAYAWPDYHPAPYFTMKPEYEAAVKAAQAKGVYVGGGEHPGIDCGGYMTLLMRNSKTDPTYNSYSSNVVAQKRYLDDHPERYQKVQGVSGTKQLKLGDIFINSSQSHTYMFVGSIPGFHGNSTSASISFTGRSWRTPMASTAYDFTSATWYRLKQ